MTNSPTPNPNRQRRLTADELIAIVVAIAGIGTVFFWGITQKNSLLNSFSSGISSLNGNSKGDRQVLGGEVFGNNQPNGLNERSNIDKPVAPVAKSGETLETPVESTTIAPSQSVETTPVEALTPNTSVLPIVVPAVSALLPIVKAPVFNDVPKQFWAATYIEELGKRGILDDFGAGKFDPSKSITRGEYAKMLDRAFADKPVKGRAFAFTDIPSEYPRKEAINSSVTHGFMTGYSQTKFAPNQQIPRFQLQIALAKGLDLPVSTSQDKVLNKFADSKKLPKYALGKMASAVEAGFIIKDTTATELNPLKNATRADAAALLYQALVKEGKIK